MKGVYKSFLLIAGLLLLLCSLGMFVFGFLGSPSKPPSTDDTSRYTAALKIVANANVSDHPPATPTPDMPANNSNGSLITPTPPPTPTPIEQPTPSPTPVERPTPLPTPVVA